MLNLLFLLIELVLITAVCLPLAIFAPLTAALVIIVAVLTAVIFLRPARRLTLYIREKRRRVVRRFRPRAVPTGLTLRPAGGLTPAEVFRLMELTGVVPKNRRPMADFTATLLDLNRRGIVSLRMGEGEDLLRSDGMRVIIRHDLDIRTLPPHEARFLHLLRRAGGPAFSVQLSAFADFVSHSPAAAHRETDAFRRAVDKSLFRKKCFGYLREKKKRTKNGVRTLLVPRRVRVITPRGEQLAALWRAYIRNICTRPFLDSYQPRAGSDMKPFAADAAQLLVDAAAAGCCAQAAEALMREYLFEPMDLWPETNYFSTLTETRCAFAGTESGEAYFFMPLRRFESAIQTATLYGHGSGESVLENLDTL